MKRTHLLSISALLLLFTASYVFADDIILSNLKVVNITNAKLALKGDVFGYFSDETAVIDTELKRSIYRKTSEFRQLQDSLKILSTLIRQGKVRMKLPPTLIDCEISDYLLKQKKFILFTGKNSNEDLFFKDFISNKNSIGDVVFENIKFGFRIDRKFNDQDLVRYCLSLPCSEEDALIIENAKDEINLIAEFNIIGVAKRSYIGFIAGGGGFEPKYKSRISISNDFLLGSNLTIIILSKSNNVIKQWSF